MGNEKKAVELAGYHSYECHIDISSVCICGLSKRVAGILKLMEDCEKAKVDTARLIARHEAAESQVIYEQERNTNNIAMNAEIHHDLIVKLEAAGAKVRELEEKLNGK